MIAVHFLSRRVLTVLPLHHEINSSFASGLIVRSLKVNHIRKQPLPLLPLCFLSDDCF